MPVTHTSSRKLEIASLMSSVLEGGRLPRADALRLRGRLQFASGQLFGRLAKKALSIVIVHAYSSRFEKFSFGLCYHQRCEVVSFMP